MAGPNSDDKDREQQRQPTSSDNPFITFRRFADQQVNSLISTFSALPAAMLASHTERQRFSLKDEDGYHHERSLKDQDDKNGELGPFERMFRDMESAMEKEEKELAKLWKESEEARNRGEEPTENTREPKVWYWSWSWPPKSSEEREREKEEWKREMELRRQRWRDTWDSPDWFWGAHRQRHQHWPFGEDDLYGQWEDYLLHDKYSPIQLERSPDLANPGTNWRYAYEDLLSETVQSETGLARGPLYYSTDRARHALTPHQWIQHLQRRHTSVMWAGMQSLAWRHASFEEGWNEPNSQPWKKIEENNSEDQLEQHPKLITWSDVVHSQYLSDETQNHNSDATNDGDSEPRSELDMYERFLGSASNTTSSVSGSTSLALPSRPSSAESTEKPSILSTLTTTERTTHPDGTVTTKVILKKRFADGSEESSETVHTSRSDGKQWEDAEKQHQTSENKEDSSKRKGWFWSK